MRILCAFGRYAYGSPARGLAYEYSNFLPALRRLGHEVQHFDIWDRSGYRDFAELNGAFLRVVENWNPEVVLTVLMGYELWRETLSLVRQGSNAVLVNWATDDSWKYEEFSRLVADCFDLYATTAHRTQAKAVRDGLQNFVQTQWAAAGDHLSEPKPARDCSYRVAFIGAAYGNRKTWIEALRARGINVACFGYGWEGGPIAADDVWTTIRDSVISLNFADSGRILTTRGMMHSRQIKARVFEVTGAGGCLLTEPAEELDRYFAPDREIVTFGEADELAAKIRALCADPGRRDAIAWGGFERTRREHTYEKRFADLLATCVRLRDARGGSSATPRSIDWSSFADACRRHGPTKVLQGWGRILRQAGTLVFGPERGPRAARRLLYELSWRLTGRRTYCAQGWPGRIFYHES